MTENGGTSQIHQPLIPSIPDEIAMECLLRLPHHFHSTLKLVCHGWRSLLSQPSFYSERRRLGAAEHLICLVQPLPTAVQPFPDGEITDMDVDGAESPATEKTQLERRLYSPPVYTLGIYNLTRREWSRLAMSPEQGGVGGEMRIPMFCQVVALADVGKLLLLGGWDPDTLEPVRDVYVIDLVSGSWRRGAPMSAARSFFAVAVAAERVYVAGGHDGQKNALRSAEVYDVAENAWAVLPPMAEERDECLGMSFGGGFMVVSGYATDSQGRFRPDAEWFSPDTGVWSKIDRVWPSTTASPRTTAVGGGSDGGRRRWWWLAGNGSQQEEESGVVMEFDWDEMKWKPVRKIRIPGGLSGGSSLCVVDTGRDAAGAGNGFFVMGNGGASGGGGIGGDWVFVVEDGGSIWKHVETGAGFLGFPFSSTQLLI